MSAMRRSSPRHPRLDPTRSDRAKGPSRDHDAALRGTIWNLSGFNPGLPAPTGILDGAGVNADSPLERRSPNPERAVVARPYSVAPPFGPVTELGRLGPVEATLRTDPRTARRWTRSLGVGAGIPRECSALAVRGSRS